MSDDPTFLLELLGCLVPLTLMSTDREVTRKTLANMSLSLNCLLHALHQLGKNYSTNNTPTQTVMGPFLK